MFEEQPEISNSPSCSGQDTDGLPLSAQVTRHSRTLKKTPPSAVHWVKSYSFKASGGLHSLIAHSLSFVPPQLIISWKPPAQVWQLEHWISAPGMHSDVIYCVPVQELQVVHIEIPPELPPGVRKLDPAIQVPQELPEAPLRLRLAQVSQLVPDR